jgi:hypothetical protein
MSADLSIGQEHKMLYRLIFLVFCLAIIPQQALAKERLLCQTCTSRMPSLLPTVEVPESLGLNLGRSTSGRALYAHKKFRQCSLISAGVLVLGTSTLLTGVRLFNNGNNAKKNAAGDTLINVGIGIDLAAILPVGVAYLWWRKAR